MVKAATIHPAQRAAIVALESFHRDFIALNHALSEVGFGYLLVAKHTYENAVAALNHTRWDDAEGRDRRYQRLEEATERLRSAHGDVDKACSALREEASLQSEERTQYLLFAAQSAEAELARLMQSVEAAFVARSKGR